jgi:hypothetical protein
MEIVSYSYNGVTRAVGGLERGGSGGGGRRGRRSRWLPAGQEATLSELIIDYWERHPDARPREIAQALGIGDDAKAGGGYVSQVLYRYRHYRKEGRTGEPEGAEVAEASSAVGQEFDEESGDVGGQAEASFSGGQEFEDVGGQFEMVQRLLGRLMLLWIRKRLLNPVVVRRWIFDSVTIRNEDEYRLFADLVADSGSWLYGEDGGGEPGA